MVPQMCNFCHKLNAMCSAKLDKHALYREFTRSLRWPKNCTPYIQRMEVAVVFVQAAHDS
jgi:hypothetical protein